MVFLQNTLGKASVPIIAPIPFSSLVVDYASALRIGLAIFSLLDLLGFDGIDTRSNPYAPCSEATYLEACFRTSFSDSHRIFALLGHCRGSNLFGNMGVTIAPLSRGW